MKKIVTISASALLAAGMTVGLTACTPGNNTGGGTVAGAAVGGLLGAALFPGSGQWMGIVGGALVGGIVGNQIGQSMDRRDAMRAQQIYVSQSGQGSWTNNRGYYYTIEPVKRYHRSGRYCREYRTTAKIGSKTRTVYGTACRQRDGSWKVV